jgi:SapC
METAPVSEIALTGQVMLYAKPELLSKEAHGNLGVNPAPTRFGFAATTHVCPLTVPEFGPAGLSYPIIFVGSDYNPLVVMGILDGQNLFASPELGFELDAYIPCYIRRYPFVLANTTNGPPGDENRMLVGIDRGYEYIAEKAEYPFFENGEPTQYTRNCIQFCNDFDTQVRMTRQFVDALIQLDLFETRSASFTPQNPDGSPAGEPQKIAEFFAVSEAKLNALPPEKLAELRATGALQQVYAHMNSLFGWERLIVRAVSRQQQAMTANTANA